MTRKITRSLIVVFFVFYVGFQAINGDQGGYALWVESHRRSLLEAELARVKSEREALAHRVDLLRDGSLDPDLLDEQSRRFLGVTGPDEIVLYTPKKRKESSE